MSNETDWVKRVNGNSEKEVDDIYHSVAENDSFPRLLAALVKGNQATPRAAPDRAVPDGYGYVPHIPAHTSPAPQECVTVAYHAHPGDISSDFASYLIMHSGDAGHRFHPVIATFGEGATLAHPLPDGTDLKAIRMEEEERACAILGVKPDYLKTEEGGHFPDRELLGHLPALKEQIKQDIKKRKPDRILLPSPWPDHADHLAVYIAGMNAILELKKEHFFDNHKIEILACEPEFGVAAGKENTLSRIPKAYGGTSDSHAALDYFPYKYGLAEGGAAGAAFDITTARDKEVLKDIAHHPVAVPPVIVTVAPEMVKKKIAALLEHKTQANGKKYDRLIPALDHLRGLLVGEEWGMGIYPIQIQGVTNGGPSFIDSMKPGTGKVFQLQKGAPSREVPVSHLARAHDAEPYMGMWI